MLRYRTRPGSASPAVRAATRALVLTELRSSRGAILVAGLATLVAQAGVFTGPLLLAVAVDQGLQGGRPGLTAVLGLAIVAAAGVAGLAQALEVRAWSIIYPGVQQRLRDRMAEHLLHLDEPFFRGRSRGELLSLCTSDVQTIGSAFDAVGYGLGRLVAGVVILAVSGVLYPVLTLVVVAPIAVGLVAAFVLAPRYERASSRLQRARADTAMVIEDTLAGVQVVKGLGAEGAVGGRFRDVSDVLYDRGMAYARLDANFRAGLDAVPLMAIAALLLVGGGAVVDGDVPAGALVAFAAYVPQLTSTAVSLASLATMVQTGLGSARRLATILETGRTVTDPSRPRGRDAGAPLALSLRGVTLGLASQRVLDGVDLDVGADEVVAVVGPAGSGKSVLLAMACRLLDPDSGTVVLGGVDVRELALADVRRFAALADQPPVLLKDTVRENVLWLRPTAAPERLALAARISGLDAVVDHLPAGWRTRIGADGRGLSGGQRRRLGLTRALVPPAGILLLDDVTSSLDAESERTVVARLGEELAGRAALVVTRRPPLLAIADRIVVLVGGRIVAEGTPDQLERTSPEYCRLVRDQGAPA